MKWIVDAAILSISIVPLYASGQGPSHRHIWIPGYRGWKGRGVRFSDRWELPPRGGIPRAAERRVTIPGGRPLVEVKWGR